MNKFGKKNVLYEILDSFIPLKILRLTRHYSITHKHKHIETDLQFLLFLRCSTILMHRNYSLNDVNGMKN